MKTELERLRKKIAKQVVVAIGAKRKQKEELLKAIMVHMELIKEGALRREAKEKKK